MAFYQAEFKLPALPEFINWQYDQLNVFNKRNRKFDFYKHSYVYECIAALNTHEYEC